MAPCLVILCLALWCHSIAEGLDPFELVVVEPKAGDRWDVTSQQQVKWTKGSSIEDCAIDLILSPRGPGTEPDKIASLGDGSIVGSRFFFEPSVPVGALLFSNELIEDFTASIRVSANQGDATAVSGTFTIFDPANTPVTGAQALGAIVTDYIAVILFACGLLACGVYFYWSKPFADDLLLEDLLEVDDEEEALPAIAPAYPIKLTDCIPQLKTPRLRKATNTAGEEKVAWGDTGSSQLPITEAEVISTPHGSSEGLRLAPLLETVEAQPVTPSGAIHWPKAITYRGAYWQAFFGFGRQQQPQEPSLSPGSRGVTPASGLGNTVE
ncbi:unnamed protein product, partial [Chrysoparadoxa australica]